MVQAIIGLVMKKYGQWKISTGIEDKVHAAFSQVAMRASMQRLSFDAAFCRALFRLAEGEIVDVEELVRLGTAVEREGKPVVSKAALIIDLKDFAYALANAWRVISPNAGDVPTAFTVFLRNIDMLAILQRSFDEWKPFREAMSPVFIPSEQIGISQKEVRKLPPFGGEPGKWHTLSPSSSPPKEGYRLIPGEIWWDYIHKKWRRYQAIRKKDLNLKLWPPCLAPPSSQGLFFTDRESLEGIMLPEQFAHRYGLSLPDQQDCQLNGCAIIKFHLPQQGDVVLPNPYPGQTPGLSPGGAREWKTTFNLPLNSSMEVTYIDSDENGVRSYNIVL
jgi:hypothetical protein